MPAGITISDHPIVAFTHDLAISLYNRPYGHFSGRLGLGRDRQRPAHRSFLVLVPDQPDSFPVIFNQ